MTYSEVALGEVLELDLGQVTVEPADTYKLAGILSFGKGLFARTPIVGVDTSYKVLSQLKEGQFVYARLSAWEGGVAVVGPDYAGMYVSSEFPVFNLARERVTPDYLSLICRWPDFWNALFERARGMGSKVGARRLRVHPEQLLEVRIPLPHIEEQRVLAAKLDDVAAQLNRAKMLHGRATTLAPLVTRAGVEKALNRISRHVPLTAVAEVNPRPSHLEETTPVAFVPMALVDEVTGTIRSPETKHAGEIGSGYKQFRSGDVIFARITPSMQNGKSAVVRLEHEWGYGSTEFHVIRPGRDVIPEWIHAVVRTMSFRRVAQQRFTGTAGQQRVPASFLMDTTIPLPDTVEEQRRIIDEIAQVNQTELSLRHLYETRSLRLSALWVSALNQAFNGGR